MDDIWQAYVPHKLFTTGAGFLYGRFDVNRSIVCITGIRVADKSADFDGIIGTWDVYPRKISAKSSAQKEKCWIKLQKTRTGEIECDFFVNTHKVTCNCVIYDPKDLNRSYFLKTTASNGPSYESYEQLSDGTNCIAGAILSLNLCTTELWKSKTDISFCKKTPKSKASACLDNVFLKFLTIFHCIGATLDNCLCQNDHLKTIVDTPAVTHQLVNRSRQISKVTSVKRPFPSARLGFLNVFTKQILDTTLGLLLMYVLMENDLSNQIAAFILFWAEYVAEQLNSLLNWLMGAPAGLKLNSHLTEFLGHFFLYHIYLWRGYLSLLQPVLGTLLWYTSSVGVLGLTVQLCLLQDILSTMTLHIYCFYVYAARLYRIQVYMLSSLWRLFRGKKWNVLRYRVDSASFDVDQLFVGTLLFTILLFLLPTTTLYYVVFTVLRLVVLMFQGLLSRIVHMINEIPAHSILLWMTRSRSIAGDIVLNVIPVDEESNCSAMFTMQINCVPLEKVLQKSRLPCHTYQRESNDSWGTFLKNLIKGHLIYPWIDTEKKMNNSDR